jgi:predicted GNAT superfamily acetyltransferase
MNDAITIRRAESIEDYRACQHAQRRAWGLEDDTYVIPVATMVGAQLHGGLVLGAFLPDGRAVGVSFAFLGRVEGRICLYSQLTGIVPEYQERGIGGRLKEAQRDFARAEGIERIAWAFDLFQVRNARFNFQKLGATGVRFVENMYGPRTDPLNLGTPTDRLIVVWETAPQAPCGDRERPFEGDLLVRLDEASIPRPVDAARLDSPRALLEIPTSMKHLRQDNPRLAEQWREAVRHAFQAAFHAGYQAVGFKVVDKDMRCFYLMEKKK